MRALLLLALAPLLLSQERPRPIADAAADANDEIRAVVILSRHGVRAPLSSEIRESAYNAQPWPAWPVASGVLTEHGGAALRLMGAWYRARYTGIFPMGGRAGARSPIRVSGWNLPDAGLAPLAARETAYGLLGQAMAERQQGRLQSAVLALRSLRREFPDSPEASVALVSLGNLLIDDDEATEALPLFQQYRQQSPNGALVPEAMAGQARALAAALQQIALEQKIAPARRDRLLHLDPHCRHPRSS